MKYILGIRPFVLHRNDDLPWLCPVRAMLEWFAVRYHYAEESEREGPLFCNIGNDGRLKSSTRLVSTIEYIYYYFKKLKLTNISYRPITPS